MSKSFAYNLNDIPAYDVSGSFSYTTNSIFAIGEIDKVSIVNAANIKNYQIHLVFCHPLQKDATLY